MKKLLEILQNSLFWSYERATWQYDLAVIGIIAFVLLAPARWFNDRPSVAGATDVAAVQFVREDDGVRVYRVEARALTTMKPDPGFERRTHEFLGKNVEELKGAAFQVVRMEAARDNEGSVLYYDVHIKR